MLDLEASTGSRALASFISSFLAAQSEQAGNLMPTPRSVRWLGPESVRFRCHALNMYSQCLDGGLQCSGYI